MTSTSSDVRTRIGQGGPVESDLGWALGVVFRRYAKAAAAALEDVPGGPRGYQVLATTNSEGPKLAITSLSPRPAATTSAMPSSMTNRS